MKYLLIGIIGLFISCSVSAQDELIYNYSLDDGLPSSFLKFADQLPDRRIILSTDNGISIFNGYDFINYGMESGLPNQLVKDFFVDDSLNLWVGTNSGLVWQHLNNLDSGFIDIELPASALSMEIRKLFQDSKNRIWIGTTRQVFVYDGKQVLTVNLPVNTYLNDYVRSFSFAEDLTGGIWIGTHGDGMYYVSASSTQPVKFTGFSTQEAIRGIYPIENGNSYFIGTRTHLYKMDINAENPLSSRVSRFITNLPMVDCMANAGNGLFILGTDGEGWKELNLTTRVVRQLPALPSVYIKDILIDDRKNKWITHDDGLTLVPHSLFSNIQEKQGLPNGYVSSVLTDRNNRAWIGTYYGLYLSEYPFDKAVEIEGPTTNMWIKAMVWDPENDQVYIADRSSIYRFNPNNRQLTYLTRIQSETEIENATLDQGGGLWITNNKELFSYQPSTNQLTSYKNGSDFDGHFNHVIPGKNNEVWAVGNQNTVYRIKTNSGEFEKVNIEPLLNGESIDILTAFYDSDDQLWLGSNKGAFKLSLDLQPQITEMKDQDGNSIDNVKFLVGHSKKIWIGTNRKLIHIDYSTQNNPVYYTFRKTDGLLSTSFSNWAVFMDTRGRIWMGTNIGLTYYTGEAFESGFAPVDIQQWNTNLLQFNHTDSQVLSARTRTIEFQFYAIDYPNENIFYQTRILGLGNEWSKPTKTRFSTLNINQSGDFTFQVRAAKHIGNWSEITSVKFEIEPLWFMKWYSLTLISIGFILFVFLFIRWRLRKLDAQNQKLETEIKKRTADVLKKDEQLSVLLQEMEEKGAQIYEESVMLNENISSMSAGTVQQSSSIAQTTATMEELAKSNTMIEDSAYKVSDLASKTQQVIQNVTTMIHQNLNQMEKVKRTSEDQNTRVINLAEQAQNINKISEFIEKVNDQTQLIAFNAAIEASISGELGRRFGVIADEIRNLSHDINSSTKEIKSLIETMLSELDEVVKATDENAKGINESVKMVNDVVDVFNDILHSTNQMNVSTLNISNSTAQQSQANSQMVSSLKEIAEVSNSLVTSIQSISATSNKMESIAKFFMEVNKHDHN